MVVRLVRWLCALCITAASVATLADEPGPARRELDRFLKDLVTFTADFTQRVYDETGAELETSHGRVEIARPGKFAWHYTDPYRQAIISNGHTLWLYDEDLAQVTVNAVASSAAGSAAELLGTSVDLDARYRAEELGQRDGLVWIKLTPRTAGQQYTAVEVGFTPQTLAAIRLSDNLGQVTALEFTALQRNPSVPPAAFEFVPPPGVDVVTGVGASNGSAP